MVRNLSRVQLFIWCNKIIHLFYHWPTVECKQRRGRQRRGRLRTRRQSRSLAHNIQEWTGYNISILVCYAEGKAVADWVLMIPSWHYYGPWQGLRDERNISGTFVCKHPNCVLDMFNCWSSFVSIYQTIQHFVLLSLTTLFPVVTSWSSPSWLITTPRPPTHTQMIIFPWWAAGGRGDIVFNSE